LWFLADLGSEKQSQSKPIYSYCVLRAAYCVKEKSKNERKFGVYSCEFVVNLKKQSQFVGMLNWRKVLYEK